MNNQKLFSDGGACVSLFLLLELWTHIHVLVLCCCIIFFLFFFSFLFEMDTSICDFLSFLRLQQRKLMMMIGVRQVIMPTLVSMLRGEFFFVRKKRAQKSIFFWGFLSVVNFNHYFPLFSFHSFLFHLFTSSFFCRTGLKRSQERKKISQDEKNK